jgi:hypothetical protein
LPIAERARLAARLTKLRDAEDPKFQTGALVLSVDGPREGTGAKNERRRIRVGTVGSILGHTGLLLFILLSASHHVVRSDRIPIAIDTFGREKHTPETASKSSGSEGKLNLEVFKKSLEVAQTMPRVSESDANDHGMSVDQRERAIPKSSFSESAQSQEIAEHYLWNAGQTSADGGGSLIDFIEQGTKESPDLQIVRHTDWQANPVEDNKLTYSTPGSAVQLTVREASSAGFAGTDFARGFGLNNDDNADPTGLTPTPWGANAMAKSQKVDWTIVNLKNLGVTAFGYHSEVGNEFQPFGQTKTEFATAGTSTMKAGGQVRVGAFGFGFAQSSITNKDDSVANFSAVQQEASVTLDLPHLLPAQASSGLVSKVVPTIWMTASDRQAPNSDQAGTVTTSFGGSWNWNIGQATLGYWNYSSDGNVGLGSEWSGHGFDANLGAYYSSFGVDVSLSYGHSSWQSAGALYNSSVTVSYTPDKLPGLWASAAAGNYDHNAIAYGSTSSDLYGVSTNGEYWSIAAGLDVTNWFWAPELSESGALNGQRSSVKLLYRYTDALSFDSSAGTGRDMNSLVAMMIQRKF